jgi:hypothetical protein
MYLNKEKPGYFKTNLVREAGWRKIGARLTLLDIF